MKTALKNKTKAISRVPQSREDAVWAVGRIGALRREIAQHKATADEAVRIAGELLEKKTADLMIELSEHEKGLQTWCEANRLALTADGKVKYHDFGTGRINWRLRPPKVSIRGAEAVIEAFKKFGFTQFLRTKEEINKEAMLADPEKARLVAGVTITSEGERPMTSPVSFHVRKLVDQSNCPACGHKIVNGGGGVAFAISTFACGSEFIVANGVIAVSRPCPTGSHIAAAQLNKEAAEDAAKAGAV